jgi:hypothetical protein
MRSSTSATILLALFSASTLHTVTAQTDSCDNFVPAGEVGLGYTYTCGVGSPPPGGGATIPDCGGTFGAIFHDSDQYEVSWNTGDYCSGGWTDAAWSVVCAADGSGTVIAVQHTLEDGSVDLFAGCYESGASCEYIFLGLSETYNSKRVNCVFNGNFNN